MWAQIKTMLTAPAICTIALSGCLVAQTSPNAAADHESNRAVQAVDAGVHAEVDGQPHEPVPAEGAPVRPAPHTAKPSPAVAFWPRRASAPAAAHNPSTPRKSAVMTPPAQPTAINADNKNKNVKDNAKRSAQSSAISPTRDPYADSSLAVIPKNYEPQTDADTSAPAIGNPFAPVRPPAEGAAQNPSTFSSFHRGKSVPAKKRGPRKASPQVPAPVN